MSPVVDGPSINDLVGFLRRWNKQDVLELAQRYPKEQTSLVVSWGDLHAFDSSFADRYFAESDEVAERLTEALRNYDLPIDVSLDDARVRVSDLPDPEIYTVGSPLVSEIEGEVKGIRGQVSKQSKNKRILTTGAFECTRCGTITRVPQTEEKRTTPHECQGCEREGPFTINHQESTKEDHQLVRLQTPPETSEGGSTESIDIVFREDLVDAVSPGDRLVANSLIELEPESEESRVFEPKGYAESVDRLEGDYDDIDVTEHIDRIQEVAAGDNPVESVVDSIAPTHEGDEIIKEAIALQLFGGVDKKLSDGSDMRGTIHILLIGDPGCGKSSLLRYVKELAPRSVFTTGQGSTAAGLTAAAVQDDFGASSWTLEAGALVEANNGVCAIDELDDMAQEDHAGMLEALSDQEVSTSKAGINATLPAATTVLAAANPIHGRFDEFEALADQFDLPANLVSRFDLIFPMQDKPDEDRDGRIADTVLDSAEAGQRLERGEDVGDAAPVPEIEPEVLRAYIAHAKDVTPVITSETKDLIREQYLSLRQAGGDGDNGPVAVTPRMMEALVRLSEASARIRLSEEISVADAKRAARIHQSYLEDVGIDPETGEFDTDIVETGTSHSQRDRIRSLEDIIDEIAAEYDAGAPVEEVKETAEVEGMDPDKVEHTIQKLKDEASIYQPSEDHLRVI